MQSGEVLAGRFEIEQLAGSGGMGMVYRALDRQTGRRVAVKVLYRRGIRDLQRFEREAVCLAKLDHPAIVRYLAHGVEDEQAYLVMDWLEGESLAARLDRARLTLAEAVAVAARVAEALAAAHAAGVVHRDLKPSNLLLVDGALDRVAIIDFGLARGDGEAPITATGATLGTPGYMAPEQVKRPQAVDRRADLFSLGGVLFHALTGRPPFEGTDPLATMIATASDDAPRVSSLVEGVPAALDDIVARLLARDPAGRPDDVASELRAIEADIQAKRLGWSVPQKIAPAAARETLAVEPERDRGDQRVFRPVEVIDVRASTVTPDALPPVGAAVSTLETGEAPRGASDPGAVPKGESGQRTSVDPAASGPARAGMHPSTIVLLTLLVVMVVLGGSCTACVYCTCLSPHPAARVSPAPKSATKDGGASAPARPAPRPTAR